MDDDFKEIIRAVLEENPDIDIYKIIANTALERFLLFINDEVSIINNYIKEFEINNNLLQKITWNYLKICYREAEKYDNSLTKIKVKSLKRIILNKNSNFIEELKLMLNILITTI